MFTAAYTVHVYKPEMSLEDATAARGKLQAVMEEQLRELKKIESQHAKEILKHKAALAEVHVILARLNIALAKVETIILYWKFVAANKLWAAKKAELERWNRRGGIKPAELTREYIGELELATMNAEIAFEERRLSVEAARAIARDMEAEELHLKMQLAKKKGNETQKRQPNVREEKSGLAQLFAAAAVTWFIVEAIGS